MEGAELKRVLHVDDDPDILAVTRMALEKIGGMMLRQCARGGEAPAAAIEFAPDLIVLDVMMPDMDGAATLKALRALPATAAIPVVFMTAKAQPEERASLLGLGALGVIVKPFNPLTLPDELRRIWAARPAPTRTPPPGDPGSP
ncbi:MAG TPA: response regulator [Burkholderiales bacterium]|nr:response regulator [Burkholderiales bacterium]